MNLARLNGRSRTAFFLSSILGLSLTWFLGCTFSFPGPLPGPDPNASILTGRPVPPTAKVTSPGSGANLTARENDPNGYIDIVYQIGNISSQNLGLRVYYDFDKDPNNGRIIVDPNMSANPVNLGQFVGSGSYRIKTPGILRGTYYISIDVVVTSTGETVVAVSDGTITIVPAPQITFNAPLTDISIPQDGNTIIQFTSTQSLLSWTVFYDRDNDPNNSNEVAIASGSGSSGSPKWSVANVDPNTYYVGVKALDGSGNTPVFYAAGRITIDSPPDVRIPIVDPNYSQIWAGQSVPLIYQVSDRERELRVTIFLDADRVPGNGYEPNTGSPVIIPPDPNYQGPTPYLLDTTGVLAGPYYVGVTAEDGVNPPITQYSAIQVQVFDPNGAESVPYFQTPDPNKTISLQIGETPLPISWQVSAPARGGTLSVRYKPVDPNIPQDPNDPNLLSDPNESVIEPNLPLAAGSTTFDTLRTVVSDGMAYQLIIRSQATYPVGTPERVTIGSRIIVGSHPDISLIDPNVNPTVGLAGTLSIVWEVRNRTSEPTAVIYLDQDTRRGSGFEVALPATVTGTSVQGTYRISHFLDLTQTQVPDGKYYLFLSVNDSGNLLGSYARNTAKELVVVTVNSRRQLGDIWVGGLGRRVVTNGIPHRTAVTFTGFDFYDNAGSFISSVGDYDKDGKADFAIAAQFAKPGRSAPVGEVYLIYGATSAQLETALLHYNASPDPNLAALNLNSVATVMRGCLFTAPQQVSTPSAPSRGIQSMCVVDDLTGDGISELAFGIPYLHNADSFWASTPQSKIWVQLARPGQLRRGGVIVANTRNQFNQSASVPVESILPLQWVGNYFGVDTSGLLLEHAAAEDHTGSHTAVDPNDPNKTISITDHYIKLTAPTYGWSHPSWADANDNDIASPRHVPILSDPPLNYKDDPTNIYHWLWPQDLLVDANFDGSYQDGLQEDRCLYTGYVTIDQQGFYGSRILGDEPNSLFGESSTYCRGSLVVGSPGVDIIASASDYRAACGVVYLALMKGRVQGEVYPPWERLDYNRQVPRPSNWVISYAGVFDHPTLDTIDYFNPITGQFRGAVNMVYGAAANARLGQVASLGGPARVADPNSLKGDFNGDGLEDFAMGAPGMNSEAGAAYVFYPRLPEPYYFDLAQLNSDINDPNRRVGVQINGRTSTTENLGAVLPAGLDFNGDGYADAVFGNPLANHGSSEDGEVIILYGGAFVASPGAGFSIDDVAYGPTGNPSSPDPNLALGVVFRGAAGELAGASVASAGDFDGDGVDDLLISAPNASPVYDINGDGVAETLTGAGAVYLIYGRKDNKNTAGNSVRAYTGYIDLTLIGTQQLPGIKFIGKAIGDHLGGGRVSPDGVTQLNFARSLSAAGDVDGDGKSDVLIGAVQASPLNHKNAGEVYLIFGR